MRRLALKEFVDWYFDGSAEKLAGFLRWPAPVEPVREIEPEVGMDATLL